MKQVQKEVKVVGTRKSTKGNEKVCGQKEEGRGRVQSW